MNKLKKAAAVAVMVGGIGLVGGGVASAGGGHYDDPYGDFAVNNLQVVDCDQSFDAGTAFAPITGVTTGDQETNIGNFCTVIGSIED
ncbi:hypothetical protein M2271_001299 [Streptomyces sp. LBL]|uniref:hypothetical protein n=1 Tax=Streptomyces sp. LBL TaxID=2940562 RepID=UPI002473C201|nr:hypothetical protein [Streptomyces sp. LBL]MDH6623512.1 hypothetical protein [Streptomyces sp. LBL]